MLNRIIRMAAALAGCILFATGCIRTGSLDTDHETIRFTVGSLLLRDDATKGTLKEGSEFTTGDSFLAWAWHSAAAQQFTFGTESKVTLGSNGLWDYAPHLPWNWKDGADSYDFLAIYPGNKPVMPSSPTQPYNQYLLKASVAYDATVDQYDLMAAGYRRTDKSIAPVHLEFSHLLSAVSVEVKNAAGSVDNLGQPLTITLKSCQFVNLVKEANISVTFDRNSLAVQWPGNISETPVLGPTIPENKTLAPDASFPTTDVWDLMVPQDLDPTGGALPPTLQIVYNKGDGSDISQTVTLKDITKQGTNEAITKWEAGVQYHYLIELRIGVGIVVTVTTTPWEVVEAETPGLMI